MTPQLSIRSFTNDQYVLDKVFYANCYCVKGFKDEQKPVIVDIGAHGGFFTFMALTAGAKKVYAFEPFLENYKLLVTNVGANPIAPVVSYQLGVYTERRNIKLFYPSLRQGNYFDLADLQQTPDAEGGIHFLAPCITLDAALELVEEPVDILKISMGYAEPDVLLASQNLLKKVKHICGQTELIPEGIPILKQKLMDKGFTQFHTIPVEGEDDRIFFFASSSQLEEAFNLSNTNANLRLPTS